MKRALMLAGGGIKVGYQAGCLQVLLDEVGPKKLSFDHIDAASGGCFNAAMICSGRSGTEIAAAWREMSPWHMVSFNVPQLWKGPWARSIATLDAVRTKAFNDWGIDFAAIARWDATVCPVTFNYFNFSTKTVVPLLNTQLDADYLCACVSLIMWFPPVQKNGDTLVDAVFATDADLSEVERRGAQEVWAIWSVANLPTIRDGFFAQYFHILEQSANANFIAGWERITKNGRDGHLVRQEVPINYLFNFSRDRMAATVDLGVDDMRRYCRAQGLLPRVFVAPAPAPLPVWEPPAPPQLPVRVPTTSVSFAERLDGFYFVRRDDRFATFPLTFELTVETGDLDGFIHQPRHQARVKAGAVFVPELGGRREITQGSLELLVDERTSPPVINPGNKRMHYALRFRSEGGKPYLLAGTKYVVDGPAKNLWRDTTTLYVRLYELDDDNPKAWSVHGAGIVRLTPLAFVRQVASLRATGAPNALSAIGGVRRFCQFFLRQCWDVYARGALDYAPF